MKVSLISLGCPKNLVDSEVILGYLAKANFTLAPDWKNADIVIINTCAFLLSAVKEAEQWINKALVYKKKGQIQKVIVAGCLSQRYKRTLLDKFPEIDGAIGIDYLSDIKQLCLSKIPGVKISVRPDQIFDYKTPRLISTNHYAYIKIADGCDNFCTYCLIPSIRGRFRSRKINDIKQEAKQLAQNGVKELILIAQDTTLYGKDIYHQLSLPRLLKNLVKINGIEWIRILYTHPAHWTDELIKVIKDNPKICPYIDLPLQHISNRILKSMNRPYTRKTIENLLRKIRKIPGLAIRTSFITGFPNETEKDFQELLSFIKKQKFAHLGCFTYSREPGTASYKFPNQVPNRIKKERYHMIMTAQQKISLQRKKSFIGKRVKVIIDRELKNKQFDYIGRSQFDAPEIDGVVKIVRKHSLKASWPVINIGSFIQVKITSAQPYILFGTAD